MSLLLTVVAPMYNVDVDSTQAVSRAWKVDDTKVRDCLSIKFGQKLGE